MIHLLKNLVDLESPSSDKKAVDACTSYAVREFKKIGAKISSFPQKEIGNLYAVYYPPEYKRRDKEQILLLTHLDTVWSVGKIKKMPFYVSGNKIFGPGVLDMKAGVVMAIYSLQALNELNIQPKKRIAVFINSAEEIQSEAADQIIKDLAKKSTCALCLEPALPGGALKVQRKGRVVVRLECGGQAAHAGNPEEGVNAIDELMGQIQRLKKQKTKSISLNIGLIGGGEKANIVADNAWSILDIRFWKNSQKEKILNYVKQSPPLISGARVHFSVESSTPPMERTKASSRLLTKARKIASSLNMKLEAGRTGGSSDASFASSVGIPTLDGLGPEGKGIHSENEQLVLSSLIERTALLTQLLIQL
ncbi:MAG: M20 family metallopeptidase [Candidatus Aminicenantes bacterium]